MGREVPVGVLGLRDGRLHGRLVDRPLARLLRCGAEPRRRSSRTSCGAEAPGQPGVAPRPPGHHRPPAGWRADGSLTPRRASSTRGDGVRASRALRRGRLGDARARWGPTRASPSPPWPSASRTAILDEPRGEPRRGVARVGHDPAGAMTRRSLILAGGGYKVAFQAGVLQVWLDEAGPRVRPRRWRQRRQPQPGHVVPGHERAARSPTTGARTRPVRRHRAQLALLVEAHLGRFTAHAGPLPPQPPAALGPRLAAHPRHRARGQLQPLRLHRARARPAARARRWTRTS